MVQPHSQRHVLFDHSPPRRPYVVAASLVSATPKALLAHAIGNAGCAGLRGVLVEDIGQAETSNA